MNTAFMKKHPLGSQKSVFIDYLKTHTLELVTFYLHVTLYMLPTKITAALNEVALSYHKERGLYFLAVVFMRSLVL